MGTLRNLVTPLHQLTARDYLGRMKDEKVHCMSVAREYEESYWDGDRRYGYGGYHYIPGRWESVAQSLIDLYSLNNKSSLLDVGCGTGFLLFEIKSLNLTHYYLSFKSIPYHTPLKTFWVDFFTLSIVQSLLSGSVLLTRKSKLKRTSQLPRKIQKKS